MAKKKKQAKTWMLPAPTQRTTKAPLPEQIKADVDAKAVKLVERLKPKYVQSLPEELPFHFISDVWTKWVGSTLYFGLTCAPGPNAIGASFEDNFARMEHVGGGRFALSYMRHNDKWFKLFPSLTADECLEAVENDCHFEVG